MYYVLLFIYIQMLFLTKVLQPGVAPQVYHLHPPQGNKIHGTTRSGYLYKKSEGTHRMGVMIISNDMQYSYT